MGSGHTKLAVGSDTSRLALPTDNSRLAVDSSIRFAIVSCIAHNSWHARFIRIAHDSRRAINTDGTRVPPSRSLVTTTFGRRR